MSEAIEKLAASGQLTPEQIEDIGERVSEFMMKVAHDPDFRDEAMEKLGFDAGAIVGGAAGAGGLNFGKLMGAMAITGMAAGAANLAGDAYDKIKGSIQKARGYKDMIDANPHLRKMDAKSVQRAYSTLHTVNPTYSQDPLLSGQFVGNTVTQEGVNLDAVKNMVDAYSKMPHGRSGGGDFASRTLQGMGDPRLVGGMVGQAWERGDKGG